MKIKDFAFIIFVVSILFGFLIYFKISDYQKEKEREELRNTSSPNPNTEYIDVDKISEDYKNCYFNKLTITTQVNNNEPIINVIDECFAIKSEFTGIDNLTINSITSASKKFDVIYYQNDNSMVSTKINGESIRWQKNKGNGIVIKNNVKVITFILTDKNSAAGSVKTALKFEQK
ncbi:hypothetical protein [Empedobacter brevis]|uniref:hypothetical protein n=1 Tax=Empedobacter brevis TaxID=247 RepID=UPI0028D5364B|nr:hypothetical protein [Empedobacter brevis]